MAAEFPGCLWLPQLGNLETSVIYARQAKSRQILASLNLAEEPLDSGFGT